MPLDAAKLFTSLGLSPSETKVYLASLKLGPNSVQEIAKRAKLSRTATYDAIKSLQDHGLVSTFERGKKKFFAAEDPESAVTYFKNHIRHLESQIGTLERSLPELQMLAGGERPTVRFFEGKDAIYAVFRDVQKVQPKELFELANLEDVENILDLDVLEDAQKLLDRKHTKIKLLHHGPHAREKKNNVEYCELLPELGEFHGDIWIYGNRVVFVTFVGKIMTVIIESKSFSDTARVLFKAAWRICSMTEGKKK